MLAQLLHDRKPNLTLVKVKGDVHRRAMEALAGRIFTFHPFYFDGETDYGYLRAFVQAIRLLKTVEIRTYCTYAVFRLFGCTEEFYVDHIENFLECTRLRDLFAIDSSGMANQDIDDEQLEDSDRDIKENMLLSKLPKVQDACTKFSPNKPHVRLYGVLYLP